MLVPLLVLSTSIITVNAAPRWSGNTGNGRSWRSTQTQALPATSATSPVIVSDVNVSPVEDNSPATSSPVYVSPVSPTQAANTVVAQPQATSSVVAQPVKDVASTSSSSGDSCSGNDHMIELTNDSGQTLYLSPGGDYNVGDCGTIAPGATCKTCQPAGKGGNLQVGLTQGGGQCGTWLESNTVAIPAFDVSLIPGYAVPIQCTASDGSTTGISQSLCTGGSCSASCNSGGGLWVDATQSCNNPTGACWKPAPLDPSFSQIPFFETVGTNAYYFPYQGELTRPGVTQKINLGYSEAWRTVKCTAYKQ